MGLRHGANDPESEVTDHCIAPAERAAGNGTLEAATQGYGRALLAGAAFVLAGGAIALLAPGDRKAEPVGREEPELDLAA
jgi:hypothetical protein